MEHWCEVVIWLSRNHRRYFLDGDLRSRFAVYHAIGLLADAARGLPSEIRDGLPSVNWVGLFAMRAILVHRPWVVASDVVWSAASTDVPALLSDVQQYIERRASR